VAKLKVQFDWRVLALLPLPLLWVLADHAGHLRFADDLLLDLRFWERGELAAPVNVIYVDMDTPAIERLGNEPWPRSYYAEVAEALVTAGRVRAVGIDVVFSEAGVTHAFDMARWYEANRALARFLLKDPPVVVAAAYAARWRTNARGHRVPVEFPALRDGLPPEDRIEPPELPTFTLGPGREWSPPHVGLIDTHAGATRWVPLFAPSSIRRYDHLALTLALLYWGVAPEALVLRADALVVPRADCGVLATVPLTDGQFVEVNWFSPWRSPRNPRISFADVFDHARYLRSAEPVEQAAGREFFAQFAGAVVLIGPVDPLLQDLAPTPFDAVPVPKVGVHGNLLKTLVSGRFLHRLPPPVAHGLTIGLTLLVALFAMAGGRRGARAKLTAGLLLSAYLFFCFWFFRAGDWVLPMAAPLGGALSTAFVGVVWQLIVEEKQKGRIKGMFSSYLAPAVVNSLIESGREPELGGHEAELTAYFSDIQGFSAFSEQLPPARLVALMNEYLTACTDLVQAEGGTLDKYIGDAMVAMYGAPLALPDHAFRACVAAVRVQHRLGELREKWRAEGDRWPAIVHHLRARLGLNTGPAIIGNMGSRTRFSYTMMGDNVNLAARMESGAKLLGVFTLVTARTRAECEAHGGDRLVFRLLDRIVVKGRAQPVAVHELVGWRAAVPDRAHECFARHAEAIDRYHARDWAGAMRLFEQSALLEPCQVDRARGIESNPSLVMLARCRQLQAHPPGPGWDGVFQMTEKG